MIYVFAFACLALMGWLSPQPAPISWLSSAVFLAGFTFLGLCLVVVIAFVIGKFRDARDRRAGC